MTDTDVKKTARDMPCPMDDNLAAFKPPIPDLTHAEAMARYIGSSTHVLGGAPSGSFHRKPVPSSLPQPDPGRNVFAGGVSSKTIYNRISSTMSNSNNTPAGISTTSPWDLIEVLNRPHDASGEIPGYSIVERPDNADETSADGDRDSNEESSSSFDLSEALEDIKELDGMEGSELVKPLEDLRAILVRVAVPVPERVEILKNLQLRDNWLLFLAKHFRKVLAKIKRESDHVDERVRCLRDIFGQIAEHRVPPSSVSEPSPPEPAAPAAVVQQRSPLSPTSKQHFPSSKVAKNSPGDCPYPFLALKGNICEVTAPSTLEHKEPPPKQDVSGRSRIIAITSIGPRRRSSSFSEGSGSRDIYQVVSVPPKNFASSTAPLCIKVITSTLGTQPLDTSGLRHFSPSCERRAEEWALIQRRVPSSLIKSARLDQGTNWPQSTKKAVERLADI